VSFRYWSEFAMSLGSPIDGLDIAVGLLRGWAGQAVTSNRRA
jgi:hypothetical protein